MSGAGAHFAYENKKKRIQNYTTIGSTRRVESQFCGGTAIL
ncbi:hypothetical protein GCM10008022_47770 [Paenibacillus hunanensis]|nr:hypothetical protein GCM10008022_47770 [Paenibacillus hunanensis]